MPSPLFFSCLSQLLHLFCCGEASVRLPSLCSIFRRSVIDEVAPKIIVGQPIQYLYINGIKQVSNMRTSRRSHVALMGVFRAGCPALHSCLYILSNIFAASSKFCGAWAHLFLYSFTLSGGSKSFALLQNLCMTVWLNFFWLAVWEGGFQHR